MNRKVFLICCLSWTATATCVGIYLAGGTDPFRDAMAFINSSSSRMPAKNASEDCLGYIGQVEALQQQLAVTERVNAALFATNAAQSSLLLRLSVKHPEDRKMIYKETQEAYEPGYGELAHE